MLEYQYGCDGFQMPLAEYIAHVIQYNTNQCYIHVGQKLERLSWGLTRQTLPYHLCCTYCYTELQLKCFYLKILKTFNVKLNVHFRNNYCRVITEIMKIDI